MSFLRTFTLIHTAEGNAKEVVSFIRWFDESLNNTQYYNRSGAHDYFLSWLFAHIGMPNLVCDWIRDSAIPQSSHLRELDVRARSAYLISFGEWVREYFGENAVRNKYFHLSNAVFIKTVAIKLLEEREEQDNLWCR